MYKSTVIILMGVACYCISVLGAKWTSGKSISSAFKRASGLFFVFFYGMLAVYLEIVWLGIVGVALIVYDAAENEWNNLFRQGFRRLLRCVFRRNAPSNSQK